MSLDTVCPRCETSEQDVHELAELNKEFQDSGWGVEGGTKAPATFRQRRQELGDKARARRNCPLFPHVEEPESPEAEAGAIEPEAPKERTPRPVTGKKKTDGKDAVPEGEAGEADGSQEADGPEGEPVHEEAGEGEPVREEAGGSGGSDDAGWESA